MKSFLISYTYILSVGRQNRKVSKWEPCLVAMFKLGVLAEPVLVGRERELEEIELSLNSAVEGKGKTVFVSGEAGSGKTRLAREFLNAASKQGLAVMAGLCQSDAQVPYFPFMEAFNNYYAAQAEEESVSASLLQSQAHLGLGVPARAGIAVVTNRNAPEVLGKILSQPVVMKDLSAEFTMSCSEHLKEALSSGWDQRTLNVFLEKYYDVDCEYGNSRSKHSESFFRIHWNDSRAPRQRVKRKEPQTTLPE